MSIQGDSGAAIKIRHKITLEIIRLMMQQEKRLKNNKNYSFSENDWPKLFGIDALRNVFYTVHYCG